MLLNFDTLHVPYIVDWFVDLRHLVEYWESASVTSGFLRSLGTWPK